MAPVHTQGYTWRLSRSTPGDPAELTHHHVTIDLHFHDFRHAAGSRWLEAGWPIHHVKEMLGHANISQTDTYLNAARLGLHESMRRFDDSRCKTVAKDSTIEDRFVGNEKTQQTSKDLLH